MTAQVVEVKEDQPGESEMPSACSHAAGIPDGHTAAPQARDALNVFLQKPSSPSPKRSRLLRVAEAAEDSDKPSNDGCSFTAHPSDGPRQGGGDATGAAASSPPARSLCTTCSPQSFLQEEHYSKMVAEKSSQWFSLFPRSPCDESSVTSGSSPADSTSSPVPVIATKPPSSSTSFPCDQLGLATPPAIKSMHTPFSQVSQSSCINYYSLKGQLGFFRRTAHSHIKGLRAS